LFMIAGTSLINGNEKMLYTLAGIVAAYAYVGKLSERT
jgi:hypothetical protein